VRPERKEIKETLVMSDPRVLKDHRARMLR
jgi:hypothetical protein